MKKRHLQTSFNYKFQQQQQAKQEYHKVKKIKEKAKKTPVSATEELDYIKKLLNGEEVGDFKDDSEPINEIQWSDGTPIHYFSNKGLWFVGGKIEIR